MPEAISAEIPHAVVPPRRPPFARTLIANVAGLLFALGLVLLIAMVWQGVDSTRRSARNEIAVTLDRVDERLQILLQAAQMTAASLARAARTPPVTAATLRAALENSLAAFEQRPELSYIGLTLPDNGEYGNLERTADGTVLLWLFPGARIDDPVTRTFVLTVHGFVLREAHPTDGRDARGRPLYQAALTAPADGRWMPAYQWTVRAAHSAPLWGFSYVKALHDDTGRLLGVVDADFDIPALNRFVSSVASEYGVTIQIVQLGAAPRLIADPAVGRVPLAVPPELAPLLAAAAGTQVKRLQLNGHWRWVATRRLPLSGGGGWLVITSREDPIIATPLRRQLYEVLGMGLMLAVVLVLALMRLARRFGQPLKELEQHVAHIEQHGLDAAPPAAVGDFLETARLGAAFDRLAATLRHRQGRLRHLALHDQLTGLANRNAMPELIADALAEARRTGRQLALFYVDLDRFKTINDGFGHAFGDEVLKAVAQRLMALMRQQDTVARHGGDEFLILATGLSGMDAAQAIARQLVASLDRPLLVQDREINLSASIGVSVFPQDGDSAEDLIRNADMAMFRAKNLGRNTCQFFTHELSRQTQLRTQLETRLRAAISGTGLQLVYQPKVTLADGRISGAEALLRWLHPELGPVSPAIFIPVAEESGLIIPLTHWVLRSACAQVRAWLDADLPPVRIAVNISARQFLQEDVAAWVLRLLIEFDLPAQWLEIELTESVLAADFDKVLSTFTQLKAAGVKVSIDDFGTGNSSLSYLRRFRADALKIDQSFVRGMLSSPEDETIVLAVIALGHSLGLKVTAEGVDTAEHCRLLQQHGCDEIQGYFFSEPVPAQQFAAMVRQGRRLPAAGGRS